MISTFELLRLADILAKNAQCARAKVGCVIIENNSQNSIVSIGYNAGACPGKEICEAFEGDKSCRTIHAEVMAVNNIPEQLAHKEFMAIVNKRPCDKCSEALKNAGVKVVLYKVE